MTPGDARFEDGGERALRLRALDAEDLAVISGLCQDAVFPASEISWQPGRRRLAFLLNRVRREAGAGPERVRAVLTIEEARGVSSQGVPRGDAETVLALLSLGWEPGEDGTGRVLLTLAGDGAIAVSVEALEVTLTDVTRPYRAVSGRLPQHPDG